MISWVIAMTVILQGTAQFPKAPSAPTGNTVAATVNGKDITVGDVQQLLWDWKAAPVVDELIWVVMIEDAAKKAGVIAGEKEVSDMVDSVLGQVKKRLPAGRTIEEDLHNNGSSMHRLTLEARMQVLVKNMALKDFKPAELRRVSRIVIKPKTLDLIGKTDAKKRSDELNEKLKRREDWNALVLTYSDDTQTKATNGSIGWVQPSDLRDTVRPAVLALKAGETTSTIEQDGEYIVFKVDALGPPTGSELERVQSQIVARNIQNLYQEIEKNAKVERKIFKK